MGAFPIHISIYNRICGFITQWSRNKNGYMVPYFPKTATRHFGSNVDIFLKMNFDEAIDKKVKANKLSMRKN